MGTPLTPVADDVRTTSAVPKRRKKKVNYANNGYYTREVQQYVSYTRETIRMKLRSGLLYDKMSDLRRRFEEDWKELGKAEAFFAEYGEKIEGFLSEDHFTARKALSDLANEASQTRSKELRLGILKSDIADDALEVYRLRRKRDECEKAKSFLVRVLSHMRSAADGSLATVTTTTVVENRKNDTGESSPIITTAERDTRTDNNNDNNNNNIIAHSDLLARRVLSYEKQLRYGNVFLFERTVSLQREIDRLKERAEIVRSFTRDEQLLPPPTGATAMEEWKNVWTSRDQCSELIRSTFHGIYCDHKQLTLPFDVLIEEIHRSLYGNAYIPRDNLIMMERVECWIQKQLMKFDRDNTDHVKKGQEYSRECR